MQELTFEQVEEVNGGIAPLVAGVVLSATGSSTASLAAGVATHLAVRAVGVYTFFKLMSE